MRPKNPLKNWKINRITTSERTSFWLWPVYIKRESPETIYLVLFLAYLNTHIPVNNKACDALVPFIKVDIGEDQENVRFMWIRDPHFTAYPVSID